MIIYFLLIYLNRNCCIKHDFRNKCSTYNSSIKHSIKIKLIFLPSSKRIRRIGGCHDVIVRKLDPNVSDRLFVQPNFFHSFKLGSLFSKVFQDFFVKFRFFHQIDFARIKSVRNQNAVTNCCMTLMSKIINITCVVLRRHSAWQRNRHSESVSAHRLCDCQSVVRIHIIHATRVRASFVVIGAR